MAKAGTLDEFRPSNLNHTNDMAGAKTPIPQLSDSDKERFFAKVSTAPTAAGCLEWKGSKNRRGGYGSFMAGGKSLLAHRIAYIIEYGVNPGEFCVLHSCDNPACVNFEHLCLGTHTDNMQDMIRKGRDNYARGDASGARLHPERIRRGDAHPSRLHPGCLARGDEHGNAKLTAADIPVIRADRRTLKAIAADYGINLATIGKIKRRTLWKHIH